MASYLDYLNQIPNISNLGDTTYGAYLRKYPDVYQGYFDTADKSRFPTAESYARWHWITYGQYESRSSPTDLFAVEKGDPTTSSTSIIDDIKTDTKPIPTRTDPEVKGAGQDAMKKARNRFGRRATVLTSNLGVPGMAPINRPQARRSTVLNSLGGL